MVAEPDLPHPDPVDDRVRQEVEHRQKVHEIELGVEHPVGEEVDVHVGRDEGEYHVGQPEEDEVAREHEGGHERLVARLGLVAVVKVAGSIPAYWGCGSAVGDHYSVE